MTARRPRLHYIVGCARSGSTLLDSILGSAPGIVATGELNAILWEDLDGPRRCACGRLLRECEFWGPVLARWSSDLAPARTQDYLHRQRVFERVRSLPRLRRMARRPTPEFESYGAWTSSLVSAIADEARVDHVADSSKNPIRAWALLAGGRIDMSLVHLIRDPRGIAWSKLKLLRRTDLPAWLRNRGTVVLRMVLDWILVNRMVEHVARSYPGAPYARLRYEELVDRPAIALSRVADAVGLDLGDLGRRVESGERFSFAHIMAGNVARLNPPGPVSKDVEWTEKAPGWVRSIVWRLCGRLAGRYGYER